MKKIIALCLTFVCIVSITTSCQSRGSDGVVIFSSQEDYRNEELSHQLKEKFPDIPVTIQQMSTGNNAAKLKAEGLSTEADIVLALETTYMSQLTDFFVPLDGFSQEQYLEGINDSTFYFTWERFEGAFIVNTNILAQKNLPEPQNFQDLLKPEYQGLIVMPNPKTSGTGYMFLNSWVNQWGKDDASNYVDDLQNNIKQFTESGAGPVKMLVQGEAAIGLGMIFQGAEQISNGSPLKIIAPEEGCPFTTTSFGIIKGKEADEKVTTIFNFLNNEYIRYDKENFSPGSVLKEQKNNLGNYPDNLKPADMSTILDADLKSELLSQWKY